MTDSMDTEFQNRALDEGLEKNLIKSKKSYEKNGLTPQCAEGHGPLDLAVSKHSRFYWRCQCPGCDSMESYRELALEKCGRCFLPMAKIPSRKVRGGNFLKCINHKAHEDIEILKFRNFQSGIWDTVEKKRDDSFHQNQKPEDESVSLEKTKVLSAIARMNGLPGNQQREKKYQTQEMIGILKGSFQKTPEILKATAGVLKDHSVEEIHWVLDSLIDEDYLRYHPSVDSFLITEKGAFYLKKKKTSEPSLS